MIRKRTRNKEERQNRVIVVVEGTKSVWAEE